MKEYVPRASCICLIFLTTLRGRYYYHYSHLTDKETHREKVQSICPRWHNEQVVKEGSVPGGPAPEFTLIHFAQAPLAAALHTWVTLVFQKTNFNRTDLTFNF